MSSTKASKLERAAAAAAATREEDTAVRHESAGTAKASTGGDRPIRTTIDLSPVHHRLLAAFTVAAQGELGVAKLHQSRVWRALLDELDNSPELRTKVIKRISKQS